MYSPCRFGARRATRHTACRTWPSGRTTSPARGVVNGSLDAGSSQNQLSISPAEPGGSSTYIIRALPSHLGACFLADFRTNPCKSTPTITALFHPAFVHEWVEGSRPGAKTLTHHGFAWLNTFNQGAAFSLSFTIGCLGKASA